MIECYVFNSFLLNSLTFLSSCILACERVFVFTSGMAIFEKNLDANFGEIRYQQSQDYFVLLGYLHF